MWLLRVHPCLKESPVLNNQKSALHKLENRFVSDKLTHRDKQAGVDYLQTMSTISATYV